MPTYRNDNNTPYLMRDTVGDTKTVAPGESIQTYRIYSYPGLSLLSRTPYYNPVVSVDEVVFAKAGKQEVAVSISETRKILVYNVTGCEVTVYLESIANAPGLHSALGSSDTLEVDVDHNASKMVLVSNGAGACVVKQMKE